MVLTKKRLFVFFAICLILISLNFSFVISQDDDSGKLEGGALGDVGELGEKAGGVFGEVDPETGLPKKLGDIAEKTGEIGGAVKAQDTSYLKQEWGKMLDKIPVIKSLHNFFTKISILFQILFGEPYSASFGLLFVIMMWLLFMAVIANIIEAQFGFSGMLSFLLGIGAAIIFAQIRFFRMILNTVDKIINSFESIWVRSVVWVIIVLILVLFYYLGRYLGKYLEASRIMKSQERAGMSEKKLGKFVKGIEKG